MNGPETETRRRAPRVEIRSIQIVYLNFQSGNSGIVLDVSKDGLGFQAIESFETNELLPFRLSMPGFRHISLSGRVAWLDDTRKRGGLCVVVPVPERQAFHLWQQQYLSSLSEAEADQARWGPRDPDFASTRQLEAEESRTSLSVLLGLLVLAFCIVVGEGSHLLATTRGVGDLLSHRIARGTKPPASAAAGPQSLTLAQNAPPGPTADAPYSRTAHNRRPNRYDAQLVTPAVSPSPPGKPPSHGDPIVAAPSASAPPMSSRSVPRLIAKIPAATADRAMSEEPRNFDLLPRFSNAWSLQPKLQMRPQASALAMSTDRPDAPSAVAPSHRVVANPVETANSKSRAPDPTVASEPPASKIQPPKPLKSRTLEPTANLAACQLVSTVHPAYPKEARRQRVEGDVRLRVVVGTDGTVTSVTPLGGPALLVAAAVDATRQFHYKPALLNGEAIEAIQTVDISFKLKR